MCEASKNLGPEPSVRPRRGSSRPAAASSNQRRRLVYFSLASLWGFLIGTATLLYGFSLAGHRLELSPVAIVAMSAAIVLAVAGGVVASRAYREASRRGRP
ncbi:MAG: hypothetical protein IH848_05540 [Acidobacteria bacterium]|nr:hypothetical protein [Acidobacteriota bacterium]